MSDDRILCRIKKLLRLSKSKNKHESDLALSRAFELAAMHHIAICDIDIDDDIRKIIHQSVYVGHRIPLDRSLAIRTVSAFFNVSILCNQPDLIIVGTASDIDIAKYMLGFFTTSARTALKKFIKEEQKARRKNTPLKRRNFTRGFFYGVASILTDSASTLESKASEISAIVVLEERQRREIYIGKTFRTVPAKTSKPERKNTNAIISGFSNGKALTIRNPVTTTSNIKQLK